MADNSETRRQIMDAMDRLLLGNAERSTGALNIVQLAAEAGVKRWLLVNKHTDLRDEFKRRCQQEAHSTHRTARQTESEAEGMRKKLAKLREENKQLKVLNENYAAVINELSLLVSAKDSPSGGVRVLPPNWR
jgi:hypothetical protein